MNVSDLSHYSLFPLVGGTDSNHVITLILTGPEK